MRPVNQPAVAMVSMVHVHDPRGRWSVPASRVVRIVSATAWRATPALDLLHGAGPVAAAGAAVHRVVVVRGAGDQEVALLAAGAIDVADVDPANVLPLPSTLAASARQVAAIVVAHDASLSLLLEPEELCPSRS